jgi:hypothetical protein
VDPTWFFISGAQKSGTTWLVNSLGAHPGVACQGEAFFYGGEDNIDGWLNTETVARWASRGSVAGSWLCGLDGAGVQRLLKRGMIEAVLRRAQGLKPGATAVGDKTPLGHIREPERLHELFPDARVIEIVRDGRDVAVSHMYQAIRQGDPYYFVSPREMAAASAFHLEGRGRPVTLMTEIAVRTFAGLWRACIEGGRRAERLWGERFLRVRYEDLLEDPARIRPALTLLGVDDSEEAVRACAEGGAFERLSGGRARGEADPTSLARRGVRGEWAERFRDEDRRLYESLCGDLLTDLGYL